MQAENWLLDHTAGGRTALGYPAYDEYRADVRSAPLDEADLLAPALLAAPPAPSDYYWLRQRLPVLNQALESIAPNARIADGSTPAGLIEPLFAVLDEAGGAEVGPATLSRILHRKRPWFIPLWDRQIGSCYLADDAPTTGPAGGSAVRLAVAVQQDLAAAPEVWAGLAGIADRPPISPLRALAVVAAHLGGAAGGVPEPRDRSGAQV
ncbi:DUF6308 family protein [Kineosporia rhizophila]|uniref:DUF6308 family protein n=1 Tax=Kineosporia rhizophila TaxID=84633 RepID=UPI001E33C108|nr:DUF6308 family protein [Kineosporia rhizophila]MCE0534732.1 DUF6308 family protein [Kineosporia rhizophila]